MRSRGCPCDLAAAQLYSQSPSVPDHARCVLTRQGVSMPLGGAADALAIPKWGAGERGGSGRSGGSRLCPLAGLRVCGQGPPRVPSRFRVPEVGGGASFRWREAPSLCQGWGVPRSGAEGFSLHWRAIACGGTGQSAVGNALGLEGYGW